MGKKCLIINGSPKINGNTYFLINQFIQNCNHEVDVINAFAIGGGKGVMSCIDCGGCLKSKLCIIGDDFKKILADDYDVIVIAAPIYQSNLPGPMINIINRFNFVYNNKVGMNYKHEFKPKEAALILVGGGSCCKPLQGENNEDLPIKQAKYIFKKLNANFDAENMVLCLNTDDVDVRENEDVINNVVEMAKRFN